MARKQKKHKEINEMAGMLRWLISYADFITLLFAFFTVLYATSQVDEKKVQEFEHSVRQEMHESIISQFITQFAYTREDDPRRYLDLLQRKPSRGKKEKRQSKTTKRTGPRKPRGARNPPPPGWSILSSLNQDLEEAAEKPQFDQSVKVHLDERKLVIRLGEAGFFTSGTPEFRPGALPVLDSIGELLRKYTDVEITIEGHTDNRPIRNSRYRSNWELSTARSTVVIAYLIERHEIDPLRLVAAGYGEYRPIASNDDFDGRATNRRVDIIVRNPSPEVKAYWEQHIQARVQAQEQAAGQGKPEPPSTPTLPDPFGAPTDTPATPPPDAPTPDAAPTPGPDGDPAAMSTVDPDGIVPDAP